MHADRRQPARSTPRRNASLTVELWTMPPDWSDMTTYLEGLIRDEAIRNGLPVDGARIIVAEDAAAPARPEEV
jgi:hypothetical protein